MVPRMRGLVTSLSGGPYLPGPTWRCRRAQFLHALHAAHRHPGAFTEITGGQLPCREGRAGRKQEDRGPAGRKQPATRGGGSEAHASLAGRRGWRPPPLRACHLPRGTRHKNKGEQPPSTSQTTGDAGGGNLRAAEASSRRAGWAAAQAPAAAACPAPAVTGQQQEHGRKAAQHGANNRRRGGRAAARSARRPPGQHPHLPQTSCLLPLAWAADLPSMPPSLPPAPAGHWPGVKLPRRTARSAEVNFTPAGRMGLQAASTPTPHCPTRACTEDRVG